MSATDSAPGPQENPRALGGRRDPVGGHIVSWIHHHGRSAALARYLGLDPVWAPGWSRRRPVLIRYAAAALATLRALALTRGPLVVMLPPLPALGVALLSRIGRPTRLVADMHSGVFLDPKWRPVTGLTLRLLQGHAAIVTNESQASICRRAGIRTFVLDDPLVPPDTPAAGDGVGTYVLVVLSWAYDEPVSEILAAASGRPDVTFVLSGSAPEAARRTAPDNVVFSGFVPAEEFVRLLRGSSLVMAMTTDPDTMQRGAYEALEHIVPVVTSDTQVLRAYFRDAAVYAVPTADSIRVAVGEALARGHELRRRLHGLREEKLLEQERALEAINRYLRS